MPPVTLRAEDARLITRTSADRTGIGDYTVKRDFRRDTDQDIRREGYDYFWPNTSDDFEDNPGGQPFPNIGAVDPTGEAITLVHFARRPNGRQGIIVGTKTKLWRFFGNEDGDYYDSDYFEPPPAANAPYYAVANEQWMLIGSGFSEDGHRWEALDINGYTILNNGVDLPMTYRIEDTEVSPIYELREQGIACVGTIGEVNGILMLGDISEIHTEEFLTLMGHVGDIDGGNMTASKGAASSQVKTPADFFSSSHVGRTIVFDDATERKIVAYVDGRTVTVDGDAAPAIATQKFTLRNKASQTGASFSGLITGDVSSTTVTASSGFFSGGMVGKTIRFSNGFSATITVYTDSTHVTIDTAPDEAIVGLPFWVTNAASLVLVADADVFTSEMEGRYIVFDSGEIRQIQTVTDAKTVVVDSDSAIASEFFQIENPDSFGAFTDSSAMDRVHYRTIWSMPDEPRRFGAIVAGTMEESGQVVTLKFPTKSFEAGQEIVIAGAGVNGGNLTTTILSVSGLGQYLLVSDTATTAIEEQPVEQSDAQGSIVGFEDLQDDSSGILRIMNLSDVLVIYKETCIFTAVFTGDVDNPFDFRRIKLPQSLCLVYRWTLVDVGGQFHMYAGANAFYLFDLSSRVPRVVPQLEMISNLFFSEVSIDDMEGIFGADNGVTNEIFWFYPSTSDDKAICFNYKSLDASTSTIRMTAAATVRRPPTGIELTENLFLMGTPTGTVVVYGRAEATQDSWGENQIEDPNGGSQIFYRRSAYPFTETKSGYQSKLDSGVGDFGDKYNTKDLTAYVLCLASQSPNCGLAFKLYGYKNPNSKAELLYEEYMPSPERENLKSFFKSANFFKWSILVDGAHNPCRIAEHVFEVSVIGTASHDRRP